MRHRLLSAIVGLAWAWGATGSSAQTVNADPVPATATKTAQPSPASHAMTLMGVSMPCTDLDRSTAFYTKGMGMTARPGAGPDELELVQRGGLTP